MELDEFERQERGPYLFDVWRRKNLVHTGIGDIPLELQLSIDEQPNSEMLLAAQDIARWASSNGPYILELIYGHYRYAEVNGWLSFWSVEEGLPESRVLEQVESITLSVYEDGSANVFVDPKWDPEHKLSLTYDDGAIAEANDEPFRLENGILFPA